MAPPLDLHVLGTPPAFVLSQDQTLRRDRATPAPKGRRVAIGTETGWRHRLPAGTRTDEVFVVRSWCGIAEMTPERRPRGARARTPALALTFLCSVVKEHTLRRHTREAGRCRSSSLG